MEKMKYYTFYRDSDDFTDILNDQVLKKSIDQKITWEKHLMIGVSESSRDDVYLTIKYGTDMISSLIKDFAPIPYVDYIPEKDLSKFKPR
jgi:hypothetical protein|tara:strand:+ start:740 stop:1009 length:270 start_codon:yes stop_codon:yes gene_type:complete